MTVTPDTTPEQDEALDDLLDAVCNLDTYDDWDAMRAAAAPILAKIRRQAAADAFLEQARSLDRTGAFMRKQAQATARSSELDATAYNNQADAFYRAATKLRNAAQDKLAEGYEFTCAAFGQECDQRVPDAGDYCPKHEPEDDEDRWAE